MSWEVRTMPSGTSSFNKRDWFNPTLFKKNLTRFWPLWGLYGAAWFFLLPMNTFLARPGLSMNYQVHSLLRVALTASPVVGAVYALLVAMALFSYLMNNRPAGMLHSLPIRREGLFLTNFFSGFVFIASPTLAAALLTLVAQATKQVWLPGPVFRWFGVNLMVTLMFFAFAVCCAMFTGHILALPAFYGILNFLVIGVCFLLDAACEVLLVGFDGFGLSGSAFARWCTPAYHIFDKLEHFGYFDQGLGRWVTYPECASDVLIAVCYSLVLCCVFTSIAVIAYRHRQLERAGDVVTVGWVRPIFQYGVGVCVGLALGAFFYFIFFRDYGPWAYITCVALSAVIGAFAARMLLKKSLKVFGDWKGPAVLFLCMVLLLAGIKLDAFGFQRWVPDLGQVAEIYLAVDSTAPYDGASRVQYTVKPEGREEEAQAVLDFHRALVADLKRLDGNDPYRYGSFEPFDGDGYTTADADYVSIYYTLKNGAVVTRSYGGVPILQEEIEREGTYANLLQAIANTPEAVKQSYARGTRCEDWGVALGGTLENMAWEWDEDPEDSPRTVNPKTRMNGGVLTLTEEEARVLWDAFREDLEAGRVRRYLLESRERMENSYYYNNLTFQVVVHYNPNEKENYDIMDVDLTPEKSETSLMAAFRELGLDKYLSQWDG